MKYLNLTNPLPGIHRLNKVHGRPPALPEGIRIYAIGDIHGRLDLLDRLLHHIELEIRSFPIPRSIFVFLGDYIDRGPASAQTLERLIEHGRNRESIFLSGNHEEIAADSLRDPEIFAHWLRLGGVATLASYGITVKANIRAADIVGLQQRFNAVLPPAHRDFLQDLKACFSCGDFFFAHAGIRPGVHLSRQKGRDLLWIRKEFLSSQKNFGKIVVHAHSPAASVDVRANRIGIDTGAYASGRLTCLAIEGESLAVLDTATIP
ncbi:MAG: metallophosphoesterase [Alphaproteobacteria bacterium]|nr:metallophosphoesterase [Alphaproteobacteria bacterium]